MNAPLSKKLNEVKWGEFKIGDLFEIQNTLSFNANKLVEGNEYDYVTRTSFNQGILQTTGFVNKDNINPSGTWSLGLLQMDFFYRRKPWYAGQFVRKIVPKFDLPENVILFFTTLLNMQKKVLLSVLVRNVDEKFRNIIVSLPITPENKIDFDFMEAFIRELEEERIRELTAYLKVSGFDNYKLSKCESEALAHFNELKWKEFRIGDLYNKIELHNLNFDKKKDTSSEKSEKYTLPIVNAKHGENGIMFYGDKNIFDSEEMTIDIVQNGAVATGDVYPQPQRTGVLWDAYLIKSIKHKDSRESLFYFTATIQKSIKQKFCYEFKATWERVKEEMIFLPITSDDSPDYAFMETFISAVQKLVIKDVVLYADKKIAATKQAVHKNPSDYKTSEGFGTLEVAEHNSGGLWQK